MRITVIGGTEDQATELTSAAYFFARRLMHPNLVRALNVDINVVKRHSTLGMCDTSANDRGKYRDFEITLRSRRGDPDICQTLAHEMIHVKQYATGQLSSDAVLIAKAGKLLYTTLWMNEAWIPCGDESHYYDSPWEIEAYGREVGLYYRWRNR